MLKQRIAAFLIFLEKKYLEAGHPAGCKSFPDLVSVVKWDRAKSVLARFTGAGAPQRARNWSEPLRLWGRKCSRYLRDVNFKAVSRIALLLKC